MDDSNEHSWGSIHIVEMETRASSELPQDVRETIAGVSQIVPNMRTLFPTPRLAVIGFIHLASALAAALEIPLHNCVSMFVHGYRHHESVRKRMTDAGQS